MTRIDNDQIVDRLRWRYATKAFDPTRKISEKDWATLQESLVLAPSSFGLQPWKFVVVTDPAVKASLPAISWDQNQTRDCSHLVVFAVPHQIDAAYVDRFLRRNAEVTGTPLAALDGYRAMMLGSIEQMKGQQEPWITRQSYLPFGFILATAALLGIDACPMEGINVPAYNEKFNLAARGFTAVAACALGYRSADDKHANAPKVRWPVDEVVERV